VAPSAPVASEGVDYLLKRSSFRRVTTAESFTSGASDQSPTDPPPRVAFANVQQQQMGHFCRLATTAGPGPGCIVWSSMSG